MELVSVIVPAYNAESTICQTIDSILAQTHHELELIVVDDGSTDATAQLVKDSADPRTRLMSLDNGGVSNARNQGLGVARGELVAFLDADDIWRERKLELQIEALSAHPESGICVTAAQRITADGSIDGLMPIESPDDVTDALLNGSMIVGCISSGLVRRTTLDLVGGFDPTLSQCADWDLWLRLSLHTGFTVLTEPLVGYRVHANNMSNDVALLERDTFATLAKLFADPAAARYGGRRRQVYARHWLICAGSYLQQGKRQDTLRCISKAAGYWPPALGYALALPARRLARRAHKDQR